MKKEQREKIALMYSCMPEKVGALTDYEDVIDKINTNTFADIAYQLTRLADLETMRAVNEVRIAQGETVAYNEDMLEEDNPLDRMPKVGKPVDTPAPTCSLKEAVEIALRNIDGQAITERQFKDDIRQALASHSHPDERGDKLAQAVEHAIDALSLKLSPKEILDNWHLVRNDLKQAVAEYRGRV